MAFSTRLMAAVIGGSLLATVSTSAWAGSANDTTTTGSPSTGTSTSSGASAPAPGADHSLIGVLSPFLADAVPHDAQKRCKPDTLYSQHDVNGDPDACFLNRVDVLMIF
jgi:hypothetical protein